MEDGHLASPAPLIARNPKNLGTSGGAGFFSLAVACSSFPQMSNRTAEQRRDGVEYAGAPRLLCIWGRYGFLMKDYRMPHDPKLDYMQSVWEPPFSAFHV